MQIKYLANYNKKLQKYNVHHTAHVDEEQRTENQ